VSLTIFTVWPLAAEASYPDRSVRVVLPFTAALPISRRKFGLKSDIGNWQKVIEKAGIQKQ
jgi:hypothetical protein